MSPKETFTNKANTWLSNKFIIPAFMGVIGILFGFGVDHIKSAFVQQNQVIQLTEKFDDFSKNLLSIDEKLDSLKDKIEFTSRTSDVRLSILETDIRELRRRIDVVENHFTKNP